MVVCLWRRNRLSQDNWIRAGAIGSPTSLSSPNHSARRLWGERATVQSLHCTVRGSPVAAAVTATVRLGAIHFILP